jgi:hypothetical protein
MHEHPGQEVECIEGLSYPGKTLFEITATLEGEDDVLDKRSPKPIGALEPVVPGSFDLLVSALHQAKHRRLSRDSGPIEGRAICWQGEAPPLPREGRETSQGSPKSTGKTMAEVRVSGAIHRQSQTTGGRFCCPRGRIGQPMDRLDRRQAPSPGYRALRLRHRIYPGALNEMAWFLLALAV